MGLSAEDFRRDKEMQIPTRFESWRWRFLEGEMSEWIKCSDRLPEPCNETLVLCHFRNGLMGVECYYTAPTGEDVWTNITSRFDPDYWLPLPELPEEDAEK